MDDFYAVIMAGGGGTRLWPLSRKSHPKQALSLFDERSLFQITIDRIAPLIPLDRILAVTVKEQAELLKGLVPELPDSSYLYEPSPKGTASVIGLAALYLQERNPDSVMVVLTADHFMRDEQQFRKILTAAYGIATEGELVTLGISPTYASTGYGYIHIGNKLGESEGFAYYESLGFKEKPAEELAQEYISSGDYSWNSGMFIWRASRILEEIGRHMPELSRRLDTIRSSINTQDFTAVLAREWAKLESETIDYGVMEQAQRVVVLPADQLGWIDIGSWDRMFEIMESDDNGNIILSDSSILLGTSDSMVVKDESKVRDRLVALIGVDDLVVVDAGNVILVCKRDRAEEVRDIVKLLSDQGMESYL